MTVCVDGNTKAFTSGEVLAAYRRVKLNSSGNVVYADAGDDWLGTTVAPVITSADPATIRLRTAAGTCKVTAAGACSTTDVLYGAADGKVDDAPTGQPFGRALEAATADGDIIEVLPSCDLSQATGDAVEVTAGAGDIDALDLVYPSDQVDAVMTVLKAQASSAGRFATYICPNAIAAAANGVALKKFLLNGLNTSAGAIGDPVYLDDGTAGGYTLLKPTATDKVQVVGRIIEDHASTGAILFDLSGPQQVVHTHVDNAEGGQIPDLSGVAAGGIGGTGELADCETTEAAGSSDKIARADHVHAIGAHDLSADDGNGDQIGATAISNHSAGAVGVPFLVRASLVAAGAEDEVIIASASQKFLIVDAWMVARCTGAANVTLKNATHAFTDAVAKGTVNDTIVRFGELIAAYDDVAATAAVIATFSAAGSVDVFLLCVPIA